uniref:Chitin-binding type-2 domain-containing protein n=1 Tax=Clytia hemisphaerica TaxID=252671 RepID=A0A7M6DNT6_9CNID
ACDAAGTLWTFPCLDSLCEGKGVGEIFGVAHKSYFVTCTNSGSVCRRCTKGLIFDENIKTCVREATPTSQPPSTTIKQNFTKGESKAALCKDESSNGALIQLDGFKRQFYVQCSYGVAIYRQCAPGTVFSRKLNTCIRYTVSANGDENDDKNVEEAYWKYGGRGK